MKDFYKIAYCVNPLVMPSCTRFPAFGQDICIRVSGKNAISETTGSTLERGRTLGNKRVMLVSKEITPKLSGFESILYVTEEIHLKIGRAHV